MNSLKTKLRDIVSSIKVGAPVVTANDGNPVDVVTIKCREYYLFVDFDAESGEPTGDFSWSDDPTMNPTVPIRDVLIAQKLGDKPQ